MKLEVVFVLSCVVMISVLNAQSIVTPDNIEPELKSIVNALVNNEAAVDGIIREKRQYRGKKIHAKIED